MEDINNEQTIREISKVLGHQIENKPQLDTSKIILTSEVNPKLLRRTNITKTATTTTGAIQTVYTTPSNQDFYLTGFNISMSKLATSVCATGAIRIVLDGLGTFIGNISGFTLNASQKDVSMTLNPPLKIDRSSIIGIQSNATDTDINLSATIYGYLTEIETRL